MYDSVKSRPVAGTPALNLATPLIKGISETIGQWPRAAGAGMVGDLQWAPTVHVFDDAVGRQAALALVLSGDVRMDTIIMHGCEPASGYHTITKAEGCTVLEIDGEPATHAVARLLGPQSDRAWEDYPLFVTLGVNKGQKFGPFRESDYANRLCMAVDTDRGGLVMFENDLQEGDEVQLMHRRIDSDQVARRAVQLLDSVRDRHAFFALYMDCAGRAAACSGVEGEDATAVQQTVGSRMPLLGMYSAVAIACVGGVMQSLDWTGVLCVFSQSR